MKIRDIAAMLFLWIPGLSIAVQEPAEVKVDYAAVQRNILSFEAAINDVINGSFSSSPLAMVQRPKGVYLDGYGVVLTFLINIHTAVIHTPFGPVGTRSDDTPEVKNRRIEELKEKLIRLLQDSSDTFRQLRREDWITVVAYIEDRNIPDEPNVSKTVVLSTLKKNVDELGHKSDRLKEFRLRMKIVEY
jgi:hypothetical protein